MYCCESNIYKHSGLLFAMSLTHLYMNDEMSDYLKETNWSVTSESKTRELLDKNKLRFSITNIV